MGIINLKVSDKTGEVIAAKEVTEDGIVIITQEGKIIRIESTSVSRIGRSTQGVKIMDLDGDDRLVAAARIPERDEDEEESAEGDSSVRPTLPALKRLRKCPPATTTPKSRPVGAGSNASDRLGAPSGAAVSAVSWCPVKSVDKVSWQSS